MKTISDERTAHSKNAFKSLLALYFIASAIATLGWYFTNVTAVYWHWGITLVVCAGACIILLTARNLSGSTSAALFLAATACLMFSVSFQTYIVAAAGRWSPVPFAGYKLIAFSLAFVAPLPAWIAYLVIALCALSPTMQVLLASSDIRLNYSLAEPWVSVIYCIVAFFVVRHRYRSFELERRIGALEAEKKAVDHLARMFLGLRDLTNSPLQSIEITSHLLKEGHLTPTQAAKYLEQSLERLRGLHSILSAHEGNVDWSKSDLSFDAMQLVQQQIASMKMKL